MLPPAFRMRRSDDFTAVLRSGARARRGSLVVHARPELTGGTPRVGLVVSRAVGGSVVRHRVARRLRAQLLPRLERIPVGSGVVVRALPEAAGASSASLARDLDRGLSAVLGTGDIAGRGR